MNKPELPIDAVLPEVATAARRGTFVLVAPPGAGKTTRVPPFLEGHCDGEIWLIEPRRVAARAAARRMAEEAREAVGNRYGWQVRFERRRSAHTRVLAVTEGILLRRLQADPFLDGIGAVLLDEFHERSILADLCLALLAEVRTDARPDLCVGVMSATLDAGPVAAYLGGAPVVRSEGRSHPIQIEYRPELQDVPVATGVARAVQGVLRNHDGDVLAFLPGVREIHRAADALGGIDADVVPLHGRLSGADQDRALTAGPRRRVVLATNVAESSVTVPGVRVVIDGGWVRQPRVSPATGLPRLDTIRISSASADQRAGRAGRLGPGHCVRLWAERTQHALDAFDAPEVRHADLAGPTLQLLAWGTNAERFRWFEAPPHSALRSARLLLDSLGATDGDSLTPRGRAMAALPVHPRLAALVVAGAEHGAAELSAEVAARLSDGPLRLPDRARSTNSDVLDALDHSSMTENIRRTAHQLARAVPAATRRMPEEEALARAVLAAWPDRVALRRENDPHRARLVGGRGVALDRRSGVRHARLFVAVDVTDAQPEGRVRVASAIDEAWLQVEEGIDVRFDEASESMRARQVRRHRDLVLASQPVELPRSEAAAGLAQAAATRLSRALPEPPGIEPLLARIAFAAGVSEDEWPTPDESFLISLLPGLSYGHRSLAALRGADWRGAIRDALGWTRWQSLETLAPERYVAPSGRSFAISWMSDHPPTLAIPMQHLFGLARTPSVGGGRIPLTLHLLAPNGRPQQITNDLPGFWARTWAEVRKELRARYPKHAWPEDPLTATPGGPRRRRR